MPTIGYDLQEINIKNVKLKVYDLSGQETLRTTWKFYYESINGLIFVIDSTCLSDQHLSTEIRETIHQVFAETKDIDIPILFLANKQDLESAGTADQLEEMLMLDKAKGRTIKMMPTVGTTGEGLNAAFEWIVDAISEHEKKRQQV